MRAPLRRVALVVSFVVSMLSCGRTASAQVNAEALRSQTKKHPTFLWVSGSLVTRSGNVNGTIAGASIFAGTVQDPHLLFGKATGDYTEFSGDATIARYMAHVRYNYKLHPLLALEALVQGQHDRFRRLLFRNVLGAGVRVPFLTTDELELFSGTTYLLEGEVIAEAEPFPRESDRWHRSSTYLGANYAITKASSVSTVTYMQPRFDRPHDFRVLHESLASFAITKMLVASVGFIMRYDHEPPGGVRPLDIEVKNTLGLKF
jgi:hypothetical protein